MALIYGHRGASAYAPENTLEAFRLAMEMGAEGVELDVHLSKDGELMVVVDACHSGDATCSDVTGGEGMPPVRGIGIQFSIPRDGSVVKRGEPVKEQWLTVSACKPYQLNVEMRNVQAGKLTYAIHTLGLGVLDKSAAEMQEELARFMDESKSVLPQSPVVSGTKKQGK